MKTDCREN